MRNSRFSQPDDYEPQTFDREERIVEQYRDKKKEDLYEAEEDARREDEYSSYE